MFSGVEVITIGEGVIAYQCEEGLVPKENVEAMCGDDGRWSPDPTQHMCSEIGSTTTTTTTTATCATATTDQQGSIRLYKWYLYMHGCLNDSAFFMQFVLINKMESPFPLLLERQLQWYSFSAWEGSYWA